MLTLKQKNNGASSRQYFAIQQCPRTATVLGLSRMRWMMSRCNLNDYLPQSALEYGAYFNLLLQLTKLKFIFH